MKKQNRKVKKLSIKDNLEILIMQFIEYDNKYHCFKYFTLGFCTATLIFQVLVLIIISKKF